MKEFLRKLDLTIICIFRKALGCTKTCGWCGATWKEKCDPRCIGL